MRNQRGDIAIVGLTCLPGVDDFWRSALSGSPAESGASEGPSRITEAVDKLRSGASDVAQFEDGAGAVKLKRLADALPDADRIYAVIKAVDVLGVAPGTIGLHESDAALIRAALALYHKVLPPSPAANPAARPWIHGNIDTPRRAAVGARLLLEEWPDAQEAASESHLKEWDNEVCILSGASRAELVRAAEELLRKTGSGVELRELAHQLNLRTHGPSRLAVVASTLSDLKEKLQRGLQLLADPKRRQIRDPRGIYFFEPTEQRAGKLAFVFPGEGSQYPHMLADLCIHFPQVRQRFDELERAAPATGLPPSDYVFPCAGWPDSKRALATKQLWSLDAGIAAILTSNFALFDLLAAMQLHPDAVVGHSAGEFTALFVSGAMKGDAQQFFEEQWRMAPEMARAGEVGGAMLAAVGADASQVSSVLTGLACTIRITNENCSLQTVICGAPAAVEEAIRQFQVKGILCERLPFDRPYHTPEFAPFLAPVEEFFKRWIVRPPEIPTYSCAAIGLFPAGVEQIRALATGHWVRRVAFRQTIEAMYADGVRVFVEVGARGNLSAFITDILRGKPHLAVPANLENRSGIGQIHHLVGMLAAWGLNPDCGVLYLRRSPRRIEPRPTTRTPSREVIAAHLKNAEKFLDVQREVMQSFLAARRTAPAGRPAAPLIHSVLSLTAGRSAVAICELDPAEHLFLKDHTFGRDISVTDPELTGVAVLPLTMSIELMAETAALLVPQARITGVRDVRAHRWIAPEGGRMKLQASAEVAGPGEIRARIEDATDPGRPLAEAVLIFQNAYAVAPMAQPFELKPERPSLTAEQIYSELMFHGPAFRGVRSVDLIGEDRAVAILEALPRSSLLRSNPAPRFVFDPVMMDQMGQALGCRLEDCSRTCLYFPYQIERLEFFGPPLPVGEQVRCRVSAASEGGDVRADIEIVTQDGRVWLRCSGWTFRRFPMPAAIIRLLLSPRRAALSEPWTAPLAACHGDLVARRIDLSAIPNTLFSSASGIWLRAIAAATLSRAERRQFQAARFSETRRIEWLCGRIAAKEAVRQFLEERHGLELCPSDIEIAADERGRPHARGPWSRRLPKAPAISISHSANAVLAVASGGERVGVDIEPLDRLSRIGADDFGRAAFTPDEQRLLGTLPECESASARLRLWCAKEAAGKALGIGLSGGLLAMRALSVEPREGSIAIRLSAAGASPAITSATAEEGGYMIAICAQQEEHDETEQG